MLAAKCGAAEPEPLGGAGRQILNEDIGRGDHRLHQGQIRRLLQIDAAGFLAAVDPDVIARLPQDIIVKAAGEIAFRSLELDDPGAGIGQPAGRHRSCNRLLESDDGNTFQSACHDPGRLLKPGHETDVGPRSPPGFRACEA